MKTYPIPKRGMMRINLLHHVSATHRAKEKQQERHYWNVVENKRLDGGRVVQRHVLYLGEINSSQAAAWRKAIEVF